MELTIIKSGNGTAEVVVNGSKMLAVTTRLGSKIYKQISRQKLLSEPGILIRGGKAERWESTESIEHEGKLLFTGPAYEGETLADTDLNIEILLNIAIAFQTIIQEKIPVSGFYLPGIFILTGGGILIFPPSLINFITNQLSDNESMEFWQPYNHPEAEEKLQFPFILAVLAYKLLTGNLPYTGSSITEIREKMRKSRPVGLELLKPGINKDIAGIIDHSFSLKDVKLSDWISLLQLWKKEGAIKAVNEAELLQTQKIAVKKKNRRQKHFETSQFFSQNWKTFAVVLIVFTFVVSFSIQPIKNAMEPPYTIGMTADEVIATYYNAIIDMNIEIMEDCVNKGVGKSDIKEVTQIFVISRVRTGYEGKSGLISAQDWNDGIITVITPGEQVYGIADVEIVQLNDRTFYANYIRLYPNINNDSDSNIILPPTKTYIKDTLTLEKVKNIWIINSLERETREEE